MSSKGNGSSPRGMRKLGGGQSLNGVVGYQLPEEDGFSALRAASCGWSWVVSRDAERPRCRWGAVYLKRA